VWDSGRGRLRIGSRNEFAFWNASGSSCHFDPWDDSLFNSTVLSDAWYLPNYTPFFHDTLASVLELRLVLRAGKSRRVSFP
jgi:hypothetical protein